jgi:hypothetical protein
MVIKFDNLEDVQVKFMSTICYFEKKAVLVKDVSIGSDGFEALLYTLGGKHKSVSINDPNFRYNHFNLGYANASFIATWWFRRPIKQYRQGLKKDQLGCLASNELAESNFNFAKPFTHMLENTYPSIEQCKKLLIDQEKGVVAFHKDFAFSWDKIHKDYIIEYRSKQIGSSSSMKKFELIDEAVHLKEALQETLG